VAPLRQRRPLRNGPIPADAITFGSPYDPFHVVKLANSKLDQCRRRVQNETFGHRGRKDDPLYRARRLLVKAHERLDERGNSKLRGLLAAGDPAGEVRMTWHAKEPPEASTTSPTRTWPKSTSASLPSGTTTSTTWSPIPTPRP
jgi:hypothetical protein